MKEALRLAARDLRGGLSGLLLLWACLAVSVGAIAAVGSLASAIHSALAANGRSLLGADLVLRVAQREATPGEARAIESIGPVAKSVTLRATVVAPDGRTTLAEVSGVGPEWPLAGTVALARGGKRPGDAQAAVGRDLAERLALAPGDPIRIGYASFSVSGIIESMPATAGFALAPPVLLTPSGLQATRLVQPGSLFTTSYRVATPPGVDPHEAAVAFQRRFADGGWRALDRGDAAAGTRRFIDRVENLLLLISLVGLAIGGLGIASAARAFAASRRQTIAVLKLLGGTRAAVASVLAAEIGAVALLAILLGLAAGAATPALAAEAMRAWLPVAPETAPHPWPLARAALFGVLVTVAASWGALAQATKTRPAELLRQQVDPPASGWSWRTLAVPVLATAAAGGLAVASSANPTFTLMVLAALGVMALLFAGLGLLIRRTARRGANGSGPLVRLGVAALDRPGAATVRLSIAMGLGLSLLATLAAVSSSLIRELDTTIPGRAPALFLLDIPAAEQQRFRALAEREVPGAELRVVPTLRGSVTALNGTPVSDLRSIPEGGWILRGDRGLTFARELPPGNRITAGRWWPADYSGPPLVSIDAEAAEALDLEVGDKMTITVLGRPVEARIASLREIDWRSMGFNFAIIFAPGTLERAPFTLMATVAPQQGASTLAFERALTRELPMVSAIRVAEVVRQVRETLLALEGAVRLATAIAIAIGIVVLAGSVIATRRERQREMVLLKLVGATRGEVLQVQVVEFALLCSSVAVASVAAGTLGAWAVVRFMLELDFSPAPLALIAPPVVAVLLSLAAALLAALPALLVRPARALRAG